MNYVPKIKKKCTSDTYGIHLYEHQVNSANDLLENKQSLLGASTSSDKSLPNNWVNVGWHNIQYYSFVGIRSQSMIKNKYENNFRNKFG